MRFAAARCWKAGRGITKKLNSPFRQVVTGAGDGAIAANSVFAYLSSLD